MSEITTKELEKIANDDDYSWIKVKRLPDDHTYRELLTHYRVATAWLVEKCRQLARQLQSERQEAIEAKLEREAARRQIRGAHRALGIEYDTVETTLAEGVELLKRDWRSEQHRVARLIEKKGDQIEENQQKNNVALDMLSATVKELRIERDAARRRARELQESLEANARIKDLEAFKARVVKFHQELVDIIKERKASGEPWRRIEIIQRHINEIIQG